jgi:hypothetical protein
MRRQIGLGSDTHSYPNAEIDLNDFIDLCKKQYTSLSFPRCVIPFQYFASLPRQYLHSTSVFIHRIMFTGAQQEDFDNVRNTLCSFKNVTVYFPFDGSDVVRLMARTFETIVQLALSTSARHAREQIYTVCVHATKLRIIAVMCDEPIEIQWFRTFRTLKRLQVESVADDGPLHINCWNTNIKELDLRNCQAASTFNFLSDFSQLRSISLGQATALTLGSLSPVLQETLDVLELSNAYGVVTDELLDALVRKQVCLRKLNVPLDPDGDGVGFSLAKLTNYVLRGNRGLFVSLNLQGHKSIDSSIWDWRSVRFQFLIHLNVRHTAIRNLYGLTTLNERLYYLIVLQSMETNTNILHIHISSNEDAAVSAELGLHGLMSVHCYPQDLLQGN